MDVVAESWLEARMLSSEDGVQAVCGVLYVLQEDLNCETVICIDPQRSSCLFNHQLTSPVSS